MEYKNSPEEAAAIAVIAKELIATAEGPLVTINHHYRTAIDCFTAGFMATMGAITSVGLVVSLSNFILWLWGAL